MKYMAMVLASLFMVACRATSPHTAQSADTPATPDPDFRAVITAYDADFATLKCVLTTQHPVKSVWNTLTVIDSQTGQPLAYSFISKSENLASIGTATTEEIGLLGRRKHTQDEQITYFSTANLEIKGAKRGQEIVLGIHIGGIIIERTIR